MKQDALLSSFPRLASIVCLATLLTVSLAAQAQTAYRWVGKDGQVHYSDQPPPPVEAKDIQQKKLHVGNVVAPSAAQKAAEKFPLTLYSSPNCKENCAVARDFLNQRGVPFSEKIIQTLEDAAEYRKVTGFQDIAVPVLLAGSKTEKGFEENAWRRLLEATGYLRSSASGNAPQKSAAP